MAAHSTLQWMSRQVPQAVADLVRGDVTAAIPVHFPLARLVGRRLLIVTTVDSIVVVECRWGDWKIRAEVPLADGFAPRALTDLWLGVDQVVYPIARDDLGVANEAYRSAGGSDTSRQARRVTEARIEYSWAECADLFIGWHTASSPQRTSHLDGELAAAASLLGRSLATSSWVPHPLVPEGAVEVLIGADEVRLYAQGALRAQVPARTAFAPTTTGPVRVAGADLWVTDLEQEHLHRVRLLAARSAPAANQRPAHSDRPRNPPGTGFLRR